MISKLVDLFSYKHKESQTKLHNISQTPNIVFHVPNLGFILMKIVVLIYASQCGGFWPLDCTIP